VARRQWRTVPSDLADHADRVFAHHEQYGYSVRQEPREVGFPGIPTLIAKRNHGRSTAIVEVQQLIDVDRLLEWSRFAKTRSTETKVIVCLPADSPRPERQEQALREAGVGMLISSDTGITELLPAHDQTIDVDLPDLAAMKLPMRRKLGPAYEKFLRGDWQDGFGEACQVLEVEARRYLKDGIGHGRLTFLTPTGRRKVYATADIDRMPIGALVAAFSQIEIQNHADAVLLNVLTSINPDRIGRTHHAAKAATQASLRKNVRKHMWALADGLEVALGIT
jgi:hypothetical protein